MSNFIGDMKELYKQQGSTFDRVYVDMTRHESNTDSVVVLETLVSTKLFNRLQDMADKKGAAINDLVVESIEDYLSDQLFFSKLRGGE